MWTKENMPPVANRRSKLPVAKYGSIMKKGLKRAISPTASTRDPKRSPVSAQRSLTREQSSVCTAGASQRRALGDLPCEQRKIVQVRRMLGGDTSAKSKSANRTTSRTKVDDSSGVKGNKVALVASGLGQVVQPNQSGIEFEKDDSALQSILDDTGIRYRPQLTANRFPATKLTRYTLGTVPKPQRVSTAPEKDCVEKFHKVCDDFLSRVGSRQANPKRQCRGAGLNTGDRFSMKLTPSKTDFCAKYGVERNVVFHGVGHRSSVLHQKPGRVSLATQMHHTPGRFSLSAQIAGSVSLHGRNKPTVGVADSGRCSVTVQPPGRISLSAQHAPHQTPSNQTPGRVSLSAQKAKQYFYSGRPSMIDHTPGRVKIQKQTIIERESSTAGNELHDSNICKNLQEEFFSSVQTPRRVPAKDVSDEQSEKRKEDNGNQPPASDVNVSGDNSLGNMQMGAERKEVISRTPLREKPTCQFATPLRVKQLQADQQTPKSTPPQRVLKPVPTPPHTPRRILVTGTNSPLCTPRMEPQRVPKSISTPTTPKRILVKAAMSPAYTPQHCPIMPKQEIPSKKSPSKTQPGEGVDKTRLGDGVNEIKLGDRVHSNRLRDGEFRTTLGYGAVQTRQGDGVGRARLGDGLDLRTIWKTKKTPQKSPIMKEVLTQGSTEGVSSPAHGDQQLPKAVALSVKRKKTLTWAAALESCQTPGTMATTCKVENELCGSPEVITQSSHDAMQDNPHQKENTSPINDTHHIRTLTATQKTPDNMQLPVTLTGSTINSNSSEIKKKHGEGSCSEADDTLVNHPSTFAQSGSDSLTVSQPDLGQHDSNILANKTQNAFLQKQIDLFNEKKRQLAQQMQIQQQFCKGCEPGPSTLEPDLDYVSQTDTVEQIPHHHGDITDNTDNNRAKLDNQNLNLCKYITNASSQGLLDSHEVNLDLNSNVTGAVSMKFNEHLQQASLLQAADLYSGTQEKPFYFSPSKPSTCSGFEDDGDEENITPYILKNKSRQTVKGRPDKKREFEDDDVELSLLQKELFLAPLWTPLAMKTIAKQQSIIDDIGEKNTTVKTCTDIDCKSAEWYFESKPKLNIEAKSDKSVLNIDSSVNSSDGLVPDESINKHLSVNEQSPKTPPKRKSAFRTVSKSGLTPIAGSLSLRANSGMKYEKRIAKTSDNLHSSVLKVANNRYLEALLDDEVSLYMCRLSPGGAVGTRREHCYDPVARILLCGDEMHFIPVESQHHQPLPHAHIQGSAFTKFTCRAT